MKKTAKKVNIVAIAVLIVTIVCVLVTSATFAVWQRKVSTSQEIETPIADFNPSLKYLHFTGLNASGEFAVADIVSYAVVGYEGLVSEIIIPETYEGLPVTKIATDPDKLEYEFSNNELITSLTIPVSVTVITSAVFQSMTALTAVTFVGTAESAAITIGNLAFANCISLTSFICVRPIVGDSVSYLWGTPVNI